MKPFINLLFASFLACSCSQSGGPVRICTDHTSDQSVYLSMPEVVFALGQIEKSLEERNLSPDKDQICFILDTILGEQAYDIRSGKNRVEISGGCSRGLLYGGLEVAEQIQLYGAVRSVNGSPFIKKRGIKFNIPLDARTPSYDDTGDAAQENITEMWSWDFWEEFLDNMAIHRYNVLSLWNPHPFPSMIRLEEYPEVALDDVFRTTLEPVGEENEWGDPQLVTSNLMENLEKVVEISMEEKILFWQKVMQHAKDRGIDIYWITWNICPNSAAPPVEPYYKTFRINLHEYEEGKHGITYQIDNQRTIDYYRKSVKEFLLSYPHVKGIGVTAGEHMPTEWNGYNREQWLWETYGLGILDAKKVQKDRTVDFIHRVWHSDMEQIMRYWKDYPDPFQVSFKYAKARLYSSTSLPFAESHIREMEPHGLDSWWNLRNDDIFVYRWGDPDYVRGFLLNLPYDHSAGYYMGSDGYVWGREFVSKDPGLSGQLEMNKHRYRFMLWGRLGYDQQLREEFFVRKLEHWYGIREGKALYDTWQTASKIIPLVNQFHWRDWDHHWSVESCQARPKMGGFRDVFDFVDNPTLESSGILNPAEYVKVLGNDCMSGQLTPMDIADSLKSLADLSMAGLAGLRTESPSPELWALLEDIHAQSALGKYYAAKITAAVHLAIFLETGLAGEKEKAVKFLEYSLKHWREYGDISSRNYHPQMLARTNSLDWSALSDSIIMEIKKVRNY